MRRAADFIVAGSGIAGLYAALKLAPYGTVVVLTKDRIREGNTQYAQGGIAAALGGHDSPDLHYEDTIKAGAGLCSAPAVRAMVEEGPEYVLDLISLGVRFDEAHGELALAREGAHSLGRVLRAGGDATGDEIERALAHRVRAEGITVVEEVLAVDLLTGANGCEGLSGIDGEGRQVWFESPAVLLATGGAGQVYANTSNSPVVTGDGMAMAWRAGAQLMDMEFFQFHPTALARTGNPRLLISEAVRGEGALLLGHDGLRFMADLHPLAELAPRDVVARAILQQSWQDGRGHVWLDARQLHGGQRASTRFPTIHRRLLEHGIDMERELIPVAPVAHYCMGGIRTDTWGRTTLPGLYACGETACLGTHGANRLASNSLLESLVFSGRAGQAAAGAKEATHPVADRTFEADRLSAISPAPRTVHVLPSAEPGSAQNGSDQAAVPSGHGNLLRTVMWRNFGLIREAQAMQAGWDQLLGLAESAAAVPQPSDAYGIRHRNLLTVGLLIAASARFRLESRGAHHRTDFPAPDPAWQVHSVTWREPGERLCCGVVPLDNVEV